MGKLILVTGGARSGKSSFAEDLVKTLGQDVLYIATSIPLDEEMRVRIRKHREQRPSSWETIEAYKDLDVCLQDRLDVKVVVMLDCITIMVTNLMFEKHLDWDNLGAEDISKVEEYIKGEIEKLLNLVKTSQTSFVFVTNEVGMGVVPEYPSGRIFRDIAGRINQILAREATEVYLCVSGIPVKIK